MNLLHKGLWQITAKWYCEHSLNIKARRPTSQQHKISNADGSFNPLQHPEVL